ncbi:unnamed protein product [Blepharisma stoltei]|uniref:protein-tyrosine-phosphatase n=1 Tax=Blepharisma stoltei TaxID=1481888 RepID=A0AAU9J405_9CILI|nr:unnamed protein product [Blepharisma stoltei]
MQYPKSEISLFTDFQTFKDAFSNQLHSKIVEELEKSGMYFKPDDLEGEIWSVPFCSNQKVFYGETDEKNNLCGYGVMLSFNCICEGTWEDGNLHGEGRMIDAENGVYVGQWSFGEKDGKGTMTYWNGNKYNGEWKNNLKCAHGILDEGETHYEGNFENDLQSGYGEQIFIDGPDFKGNFLIGNWGLIPRPGTYQNGRFYGKNRWNIPGWKYSGSFQNGKRWGSGTIERRDSGYFGAYKMIFEAKFENDLPIGEYILHTANRYISRGVWNGFRYTNHMDEVWPGILLGSAKAATNREWLDEALVKRIVRVLDKEKVELLPGFKYYHLKLKDSETQDITENLEETLEFIKHSGDKHPRILVHCYKGISRSPTILIAYLMKYGKLSFDLAYGRIKSQRLCIHPNKGFVKQLKALKFH